MPKSDIKTALDRIQANHFRYQEFYDYFDGKHKLNFASDKFKNKYGERLQKLRENLCKIVVEAPVSRLEPIGFQSDAKDIDKRTWKFWKKSRMPRKSIEVHTEAIKTGDAYVIVWKDRNGNVRIYPQLAVNMTVWRDSDTDEITKAAKCWRGEDGFYYLTLYYPDTIEKYVTKSKCDGFPTAKDFDQRHVQNEEFPLRNPFGRVPVFHFKYSGKMKDFGTSILEDVIPQQDGLNKDWADIMGAQEENMRRRRWAAGLQTEVDEETGKKINPYKPDDDLWISDDETTKFGEFTDPDTDKMLNILIAAIKAIALVSGIPPSYFNLEEVGQAISGEALRRIEARFISIIKESQINFGETWSEVMSFAMSISEIFAGELEIETQWTDAAPVSETEILDNALKKKNLGWSLEQIQRDMGLSDEQILKMQEEVKKREEEQMAAQSKFFDAGTSFDV